MTEWQQWRDISYLTLQFVFFRNKNVFRKQSRMKFIGTSLLGWYFVVFNQKHGLIKNLINEHFYQFSVLSKLIFTLLSLVFYGF